MPNFYDLPRELRDAIYEELLVFPSALLEVNVSCESGGEEVISCYDSSTVGHWGPHDWLIYPAILLANKKTYQEAIPLLYSKNRFVVYDTFATEVRSTLGSFLDKIGPQNASFLRQFTINFPRPDDEQAQLGNMALSKESTRQLDLIQDKCTGIKTLETELDSTDHALKYRFDSYTPREASDFLTLMATRYEAISSLQEVILHVYDDEPVVDHVKEKISAFGWHLKITKGSFDNRDFFGLDYSSDDSEDDSTDDDDDAEDDDDADDSAEDDDDDADDSEEDEEDEDDDAESDA